MLARNPRAPWQTIWRVATSGALLAALFLITAAVLAVSTWFPQIPPDDPIAYARQLSEAQARFGETTSLLQGLGLFTIVHSISFRVLLALLGGCLLLRLVEQIDRLHDGHQLREPTAEWREVPHSDLSRLADALRRRWYRVLDEASLLQVDRWPWAGALLPLSHLGALLLLSGLLLAYLWGWRVDPVIALRCE